MHQIERRLALPNACRAEHRTSFKDNEIERSVEILGGKLNVGFAAFGYRHLVMEIKREN
jgi:hypothetical protein